MIRNKASFVRKEECIRDFFNKMAHAPQWAELSDWERVIVWKTIRELELSPGSYVLEPGCGAGRLTAELSRAVGGDGLVFSLDFSPKMIERARDERPFSNVVYHAGSVVDIPLEDNSMDAAVCYNCFHLLDCPPRSIKEIARVLVPGGKLALVQSENLTELFDEHYLPEKLKVHTIPSPADILSMVQAFGFQVLKMPRIENGFFMLAEKGR